MIDEHLREFISRQRIARLATVDARGQPHVVPICFALERATLYSAIDEKPKRADYTRLRRLRNIEARPQAQVLFDVYDDADWSRLCWVQLRGRARVVVGGEEHDAAVMLLRARYPQYREMALESRPLIALDIERAVTWPARGDE